MEFRVYVVSGSWEWSQWMMTQLGKCHPLISTLFQVLSLNCSSFTVYLVNAMIPRRQ